MDVVEDKGKAVVGVSDDCSVEHFYVDSLIKRTFYPDHPFIFNFGAGVDGDEHKEAIVSTHYDYLVCEPQDIMKGGFEYVLINEMKFKWMKYTEHSTISCREKYLSVLGGGTIFECHYRTKTFSGEQEYIKNFSAACGKKIGLLYYQKQLLSNREDDHTQLMMACSIKEECYKKGVFHVKMTNKSSNRGVMLAVNAWEVLDLMKFRDNPKTKTGRKKPILHWVAEHAKGNNNKKVAEYKRGLQEFEYDDFTIKISEPPMHLNEFGVIQ